MTEYPPFATGFAPIMVALFDELAVRREHAPAEDATVVMTAADDDKGTTALVFLGSTEDIEELIDRMSIELRPG